MFHTYEYTFQEYFTLKTHKKFLVLRVKRHVSDVIKFFYQVGKGNYILFFLILSNRTDRNRFFKGIHRYTNIIIKQEKKNK